MPKESYKEKAPPTPISTPLFALPAPGPRFWKSALFVDASRTLIKIETAD
jgi:hypothetical protein